ncbi:collectin-12-like isoform 1-T1 [Fundulus diaphanus]
MSVELSPSNIYGNLGKFRKETDVNVFSGVIYENYPKPQKVSVELVKKEEKVKSWENQTKHLTLENIMLENVTKETIRRNDELNRMREVILAFENFPVKDFCPEKKCQPCQKDWIPFQGKCYLFWSYCYLSMYAQLFCRGEAADLVFVDNLQELKFLKNHTHWCFNNPSQYPNYWRCEVQKSFGYWAEGGLLTPEGNIIENWSSKGYSNLNGFICESEEMPWPK